MVVCGILGRSPVLQEDRRSLQPPRLVLKSSRIKRQCVGRAVVCSFFTEIWPEFLWRIFRQFSRTAEPGLCIYNRLAVSGRTLRVFIKCLYYYRQRGDMICRIINDMNHVIVLHGLECPSMGRQLNNRSGLWEELLCWCPILKKKTKGMGSPSQVSMQELLL